MNRLSEYVQDFITSDLDQEGLRDLTPEERAEAARAEAVSEIMVDDLISSRETITDGKFKSFEKLVTVVPDLIASELDDRFTRDLIKAVPGYVERTMQLSRFDASQVPSKTTSTYIREAARTYIFGFPQASVALSRAALEQALKERLARQLSGDFIDFQDLLKDAHKWNILDRATIRMARDVANAGDKVMHEKPTDLSGALEVLTKVRGLLEHIYSAEGRF